MKKSFLARLLPVALLMTLLAVTFCPIYASALVVEAPYEGAPADEIAYRIAFEDGTLSVKVNPEKIADAVEAIRANGVSKETLTDILSDWIPDDVKSTFSSGMPSAADLKELLKNYVSREDLSELAALFPKEVLVEYYMPIVKEYLPFEDIIGSMNLEEVISAIPEEDLRAVVEEITIEELLTPAMKEKAEAYLHVTDITAADVDVVELINAAGGVADFLAIYTVEELVCAAQTLDLAEVIPVIADKDVVASIDIRGMIGDLIDVAKSAIREIDYKQLVKDIASATAELVVNEIGDVKIGDTVIFHNGTLSLQNTVMGVLRLVPDVSDILALTGDEPLFDADFSYVVRGVEHKISLELGFTEAPVALQEKLAAYADLFTFEVADDDTVSVSVHLPSAAADLYGRLLTTEKLPAQVRKMLLELPTMTGEDAIDVLESITDETWQKIVDAALEKVGPVKEKAYAAADKLAEKLPSSIPADKVEELIAKAKRGVDKVLDAVSNVENIKKVRDKAIAYAGKLPDKALTTAVADFCADGTFSASVEKSFDLIPLVEKFVSVPDSIKVAVDDTLTVKVDASAKVDGLYAYELKLADGTTAEVFLPYGKDLSVLKLSDKFAVSEYGWADADGNPLTVTPAADTTVYDASLFCEVIFADENGTPIETVKYPKGAESIDEPDIPASLEKVGYVASWADYELNSAKSITVKVEYELIIQVIHFVDENDQKVADVNFTPGLTETVTEPTVPEKKGYTGAWGTYDLTLDEEQTVKPTYTANTYKVIFQKEDGTLVSEVSYTFGDASITAPAVPEKKGYTGVWQTYDLTKAADQTVKPTYTANSYKVIFQKEDGTLVSEVPYTFGATSITAPAVPEKKGYTGAWQTYDLTLGADQTVKATYTANTYKVIFQKEDGTLVSEVSYTFGATTITAPAVPDKTGYTGVWGAYDLTKAADQTVKPTYTGITYKVTYVDGTTKLGERTFVFGTTTLVGAEVTLPTKNGYTAAWNNGVHFTQAENQTVSVKWTLVEYMVTLKVGDTVVGTVKFNVETVPADLTALLPAVPEKVGYTGEWNAIDLNNLQDQEIGATYTPIVYHATFTVDGEVIDTVDFTVEDAQIPMPAVPEKEGYTGHWEEVEVSAGDKEIKAIYEKIDEPGPGPKEPEEPEPPVEPEEKHVAPTTFVLLIVTAVLLAIIILLLLLLQKKKKKNSVKPKKKKKTKKHWKKKKQKSNRVSPSKKQKLG